MFYRKICSNVIRKRPFHTGNLFLQRASVFNVKEETNRDLIQESMDHLRINSFKDWENVRKVILEHKFNRNYTNHNIDAMILGHCLKMKQFDLGESYITFLNHKKVKPNLATIGRYLRLLYYKTYESCLERGKTCSKKEEKLILQYYNDLRKEYPVLDSISLECVILALSVTSKWRECVDILTEIKVSTVPSTTSYSAVVAAAFIHGDEELGWTLLHETFSSEKTPLSITYLAYIKFIEKLRKKDAVVKGLEKLCMFFQQYNLKCGSDVAVGVAKLTKKLGYNCEFTTVTYQGVCRGCSQKLRNFELSEEDFVRLRKKVMDNVIVGRDVFVKSTPQELKQFKEFVAMGRFDVVLDGLNVAYSIGVKHSPNVYSHLVASVVSYFVQRNKKVLVLGRSHMDRWPQKSWGYVKENATVFLAQDISQDDPYLLYCALSSGKETIIVTRDLMRSHKFLLRDPELKMLFDRWLSQRQWPLIRVDKQNGAIFRQPPPFSIIAQCNQGTWHIPYETDTPKEKNEFHRTWLCLKC